MSNPECLVLNLIPYKMIVQRKIFHSSVKDWVSRKIGCSYVVTVDDWNGRRRNANFEEKRGNPANLGRCISNIAILSLS